MYDFDGNKTEITRIHAELGAMFNNKTCRWDTRPLLNAIYNFNEYWFAQGSTKIGIVGFGGRV